MINEYERETIFFRRSITAGDESVRFLGGGGGGEINKIKSDVCALIFQHRNLNWVLFCRGMNLF